MADPRIVILDDATASVDMETEHEIQEALKALMQGRTTFIIAHRISSVKDADLIIVLDRGEIVEARHPRGAARQTAGTYRRIYDVQFKDLQGVRERMESRRAEDEPGQRRRRRVPGGGGIVSQAQSGCGREPPKQADNVKAQPTVPATSGERFVYPDDQAIEKPFDWRQMRRLLGYMTPVQAGRRHRRLGDAWSGTIATLIVPLLISNAIDYGIVPGDGAYLARDGHLPGLVLFGLVVDGRASASRSPTGSVKGSCGISARRSFATCNTSRLTFSISAPPDRSWSGSSTTSTRCKSSLPTASSMS